MCSLGVTSSGWSSEQTSTLMAHSFLPSRGRHTMRDPLCPQKPRSAFADDA